MNHPVCSVLSNSSVGLEFPIGEDWKSIAKSACCTAGGDSRAIYESRDGMARLVVSLETAPVPDISLLRHDIEITRGGNPYYAETAGYPSVINELAFGRDGFFRGLDVDFILEDKLLSIKLFGPARGWKARRTAFLEDLRRLTIRSLVRDAPPGPVVVFPRQGCVLVAPAGFRLVEKSTDQVSARFVLAEQEAVFSLQRQRLPLLPADLLLDAFCRILAADGSRVLVRSTGKIMGRPSFAVEAAATINGRTVRLYFSTVLAFGWAHQVSAVCPEQYCTRFMPLFHAAADHFRIGPPFIPGEFRSRIAATPTRVARSASGHTRGHGTRRVVIECRATIKSLVTRRPAATLVLPLPASYPPYQQIRLRAWSPAADDFALDYQGNALGAWFRNELGQSPRDIVSYVYSVDIHPAALLPGASRAATAGTRTRRDRAAIVDRRLPPVLFRRLTSPLTTDSKILYRLKRLADGLAGGPDSHEDRLRFVGALVRGLAAATSPGGEGWGRGIAWAADHLEECGPQERVELLTAMLRQKSIPVRRIYGHLLPPRGEDGPVRPHAWCEIFIRGRGWLPADPSPVFNRAPAPLGVWTDRYLYLCHEGPGCVATQGPEAALLLEGFGMDENAAAMPVKVLVKRNLLQGND